MSISHGETIPFLDLKLLHRPLKPALMAAFSEAVDGAAFVGGSELHAFEKEFAAFCAAEGCAGISNGTDALVLALKAFKLPHDFLAITVPNTFIATTEAVTMAGGRFAFVDVDRDTSLMDMAALEKDLARRFDSADKSLRPQVVIPVHLYGQCVDMDALKRLADKYELRVLEDAAQAQGASWNGKPAGSMGDAAGFSFYAGKNIGGLGEAGAIVSNDASIIERAKMLREHGQTEKYVHRAEGGNYRMDAIQAAFLRIKLPCLPQWNQERRTICNAYDAAFSGCEGVRPVRIRPEGESARHLYVIHVGNRDGLAKWLAERNIQSGMHYPLPLHLQECYAGLGMGPGAFPVAEQLAKQLLSLPLFPGMTPEQVNRVVSAVREYGAE